MDILQKTMSRLSGASQATSHSSTTTKSCHSRKLSYDDAKAPSTVDWLVGLCAGSDASMRLERKRTFEYFTGLPGTPETTDSENWANAVGGEIFGERESQPSYRTPWATSNSGITFRYRHHGNATQATSCSTTCTTIDHQPYQPSITTLPTPPTPSVRNIPNGETPHIVSPSYHVILHKKSKSFLATALLEVVKAREQCAPLHLAGACEQIGQQGTTKTSVGGEFKFQLDNVIRYTERHAGGNRANNRKERYNAKKEQHKAENRKHTSAGRRARFIPAYAADPYFGNVRENAHIKDFLKENPIVYFRLTVEVQTEVRLAESRKLLYRAPTVEQTLQSKQKPGVSSGIPTKAQFQAGVAELRKSHLGPSFLRGEATHFRPTGEVHTRRGRIEAGPSSSQTTFPQFDSGISQVRAANYPNHRRTRYRPAFKDIPEEERCQPNFDDIPNEDSIHFKEYPNTYAGLKDPNSPPEERRVERPPGYFVNTPWQLQPPRTGGHCKEFVRRRDFRGPLSVNNLIDPEIVKMTAAKNEQDVRDEYNHGQPIPPARFAKGWVPRRTGANTRKSKVKPVFRPAHTPRQPGGKTSPIRGKLAFIR